MFVLSIIPLQNPELWSFNLFSAVTTVKRVQDPLYQVHPAHLFLPPLQRSSHFFSDSVVVCQDPTDGIHPIGSQSLHPCLDSQMNGVEHDSSFL